MVKGLVLNKSISLLNKIYAIVLDQLDTVNNLYHRKHRIYYERPVLSPARDVLARNLVET